MKAQTTITQATIARGTDRKTGEVFFVVKSDTQANVWYQVTWSDQALAWQCDCPSHVGCKHERATQEVLKIRRATIALAMGGQTPAIVAKLQAEEDAKLAAKGTLQNFANRREIKIEHGVPMR